MKTDLMPTFLNAYYRVTAPFEVYARVGVSESTHYYGASMILGVVYKRLTLAEGDEIHALCGGIFALTQDGVYEVTTRISDKSPFEKVYLPPSIDFPLDRLVVITPRAARAVATYRRSELPRMEPGRMVGRSIDSVLEATT